MRKGLYILFGAAILLAACEKNTADIPEGQPIYLTATLPEEGLTKVPFEGSAPTTSNPLNVAVWASTISATFKDEGHDGSAVYDHKVSIHTEGHFQSGEPQLLSQAIYPPPRQGSSGAYTADPVYFVAMHPLTDWSTTDGTEAVYKFSGCEDVMYAPQVSGAYDTNEQSEVVTNSPTLDFKHLLTRISVKMGIQLGEDENLMDVQNAWGDVTGLKIQAYNRTGDFLEGPNTVTIDLAQGSSFDYSTGLTFSYRNSEGNEVSSLGTAMSFYSKGTDEIFPPSVGFTLTEQITEVAYVMCAPVDATDADAAGNHEYVVTVTTENRGDQEVVLDLRESDAKMFSGSTRGKHFGVTLKFKKGSAIATVAEVSEWVNGGFGTGDIED